MAKTFFSHSTGDFRFVFEVARHLRPTVNVFLYEEHQRANSDFQKTIERELEICEHMVVFVGAQLTSWQDQEFHHANLRYQQDPAHKIVPVLLSMSSGECHSVPPGSFLRTFAHVSARGNTDKDALAVAVDVAKLLGIPWQSFDGLPANPHLFHYEKDIIDFFHKRSQYGDRIFGVPVTAEEEKAFPELRQALLGGAPMEWPQVEKLGFNTKPHLNTLGDTIGGFRPDTHRVLTSGLVGSSHPPDDSFSFPEAGPREWLQFPASNRSLKIAIIVAGGIAPGVNAVIDGIVQRHCLYANANTHGHLRNLEIFGLRNGFRAFDDFGSSLCPLVTGPENPHSGAIATWQHVSEGGSVLGTSRVDELLDPAARQDRFEKFNRRLREKQIDILYVIGGDGSTKAAHALFSVARTDDTRLRDRRPLSVIAVPKTMDNDILWMWQAFGFLSAVEEARKVVETLSTEIRSNPRLCIVQLFGSDSGFVVSHAVLASATGHCRLALIPEVEFSIKGIATYLKLRMREDCRDGHQIPSSLVVMAETAIPTDAMDYLRSPSGELVVDASLTPDEEDEIRRFDRIRREGRRIEGQTNDALRRAGLKIVSAGLVHWLKQPEIEPLAGGADPDWTQLRVLTNEPRHLLRAIAPTCSDIIMGNRLGTLAVDNAMAGFTDFLISQWLTEYVLVPLKLVVLGRKRIPTRGVFWKSVLSKTGQPAKLTL